MRGSATERLENFFNRKEAAKLPRQIIHTIGRHLTPEFTPWVNELRAQALVYSFSTTADLVSAWKLAKAADAYEMIAPAAVVWLQTRPGEFSQAEIDAVAIADPLARPIIVAGTFCEGEPRTGKLLADATRLYWHQETSALWAHLTDESQSEPVAGRWIAIHASQPTDYQGLAGVCQSLGLRTIWQTDRGGPISSEPDYRLFLGWQTFQSWQEPAQAGTLRILLLGFPRPDDFDRARDVGIDHILAAPFRIAELRSVLHRHQPTERLGKPASKLSVTVPNILSRAG